MKCLLCIFVAASLAIVFALPDASAQTGANELNQAEKWVVERVVAGKIADLSKRFPDQVDRKLSAHFLEDLLTGALPGVKPHRKGVRIMRAIIDERIDLTNAQVPCEFWLNNCQFMSDVFFTHASCAGEVSFFESTFKGDADFRSMKVKHVALFDSAVFEGRVPFSGADIADNFQASYAQFKNKEREATFNSIKVGRGAFFDRAMFEGG